MKQTLEERLAGLTHLALQYMRHKDSCAAVRFLMACDCDASAIKNAILDVLAERKVGPT